MTRKRIVIALGVLIVVGLIGATFWYMKNTVQLVSKDERRALVSAEVSKALERYYDEHGRYPVVYTNEELLRELSAKAYFEKEVRLDVVQYVPINEGQTYELQ
jgi:hypothetical protein